MQVGTYPTRNFALALRIDLLRGLHFLEDAIPACRHAEGTISSSSVLDVWRMASEDSDQIVSGFPSIHRLSDLSDCYETLKEFGNMSSPTILFVLQKIMNQLRNDEKANIFGAAFGPGLTMETFIASAHA